jgi:superfamily II DNA or RNA helicase
MWDWAIDNLVVDNPEYKTRKRLGKWLGDTPSTLDLYRLDRGKLIMPFGTPLKFENVTTDFAMNGEVKYYNSGKIELYDYQKSAVDEMLAKRCGILESPCGTGKTVMIMGMIEKLKLRSLFICHTHDLIKQAYNTAKAYFDEPLLGIIAEGKVNIGDITFATVQTLSKLNLREYKYHFDVIFVDEAHHVAGSVTNITMYNKVLNSLAARRKYGVTATPFRNDGLFKATQLLLGGVIHRVERQTSLKPIIIKRKTDVGLTRDCLDTDGTLIYSKFISHLCDNYGRNKMIIHDLKANATGHCLILSERISHLNALRATLSAGAVVTGKTPREQRERILEAMRDGTERYLFSTYQLAREGLDIPILDCLYLATPKRDKGSIIQALGRVCRECANKTATYVFDYVDDCVYAEHLERARNGVYKTFSR